MLTNVGYQILDFCYYLFFSNADYIYRGIDKLLKKEFSGSGDVKMYKFIKSPFWKFDPKTILSLPSMSERKQKGI